MTKVIYNQMETTKTIYIKNPSMPLVAFMKKEQERKKERMEQMREKYKKATVGNYGIG